MDKKEYLKKYREKNRLKVRKLTQDWFARNKEYRKKYMSLWKKANKDKTYKYNNKFKYKIKARIFIRRAILSGLLEKPSNKICSKCSNTANCYHHITYDLDDDFGNIVPMCAGCHNRLHKRKNHG